MPKSTAARSTNIRTMLKAGSDAAQRGCFTLRFPFSRLFTVKKEEKYCQAMVRGQNIIIKKDQNKTNTATLTTRWNFPVVEKKSKAVLLIAITSFFRDDANDPNK